MALSTAITAQGTKLQISTGVGPSKNLSAVTAGVTTTYTSTAHGFIKGDVVTISGIVGAPQANGVFTIASVTANAFTINVDTTNAVMTIPTGLAIPLAFTRIANIKSYQGLDGTSNDIDVTHLESDAKEFRVGLSDPGQFTMELDQDPTDIGQKTARASQKAQTLNTYRVIFASGSVLTFSAYCKKFSLSGAVDAVNKGSISLRITGPYTLVE